MPPYDFVFNTIFAALLSLNQGIPHPKMALKIVCSGCHIILADVIDYYLHPSPETKVNMVCCCCKRSQLGDLLVSHNLNRVSYHPPKHTLT